jgi:hypothetical protein
MTAMTCVLAASVDRILLARQRSAGDDAPSSAPVSTPALMGQPGAVSHT